MQKTTSIQKKLLRVIMLICGTVLVLTCAAFFFYEYITYKEITRRELSTLGQIIATNSTASLAFDNRDDAVEILKALRSQKHIQAACIYDNNGTIFAFYPAQAQPADFPPPVQNTVYRFGTNYLEGFEPIMQNDDRLGTLYLKSDIKDIYQRFQLYGLISLAFIIISFIFAYLLSKRLQRSISDPILQLAHAARLVSDNKDYSIRVQNKTDDELATLTSAFNYMLRQIQAQNDEISALNENLEEKIVLRTAELKDANAVLLEQNEFIETIIDASVDLIAVFDRKMCFLTVNKQTAETYNKTKEELIGRKLVEVFPDLKGSPLVTDLDRALTGELVKNMPYRSLLGERYFENFMIPLKNKNGQTERVLMIAHDITEIMRANERLVQVNTELEKSNRDLEQFAYVASHDLQEPLRKIQTFADLSQKNTQHSEILNRYLQKIVSSAGRMSNLIKAVLNYSRLSHDEEEFEEVDLNEILGQVRNDLELSIEDKKAIIHSGILPRIRAIPLQMSQLFSNLFSNSLKFTDKQPQITISCTLVPASDLMEYELTRDHQWYYRIEFSDNGIGFDQQYSDQVFAIFQRLHPSEKYAGTGIGLALCKKIVENHSGHIVVKSADGEGSSFIIFLPKEIEDEHFPETEQ